MNPQQQDRFWMLYNRESRPVIERACRAMSRAKTDSGMDECDMMAWVDDRVWRMLETSAWPAFHDEPSPECAANRLRESAGLLARWSYLGLCRKYWRRVLRQPLESTQGETTRVERLACTRSNGEQVEIDENIKADLDQIRNAISERVRGKLAASWQDRSERHRVAIMLETSSSQTATLIDQSVNNKLKPNTLLQMRSRSRRHIQEMLRPTASIVCVALLMLAASVARAEGEQTGGRKGRIACPQPGAELWSASDQSMSATTQLVGRTNGGEQSGGRGG